jgi:hypothetical protein
MAWCIVCCVCVVGVCVCGGGGGGGRRGGEPLGQGGGGVVLPPPPHTHEHTHTTAPITPSIPLQGDACLLAPPHPPPHPTHTHPHTHIPPQTDFLRRQAAALAVRNAEAQRACEELLELVGRWPRENGDVKLSADACGAFRDYCARSMYQVRRACVCVCVCVCVCKMHVRGEWRC